MTVASTRRRAHRRAAPPQTPTPRESADLLAIVEGLVATDRELLDVVAQLRLMARTTQHFAGDGGPAATAANMAFLSQFINVLAADGSRPVPGGPA